MNRKGSFLDSLSDLMDRKVCVTCEMLFENDSDEPKNRICARCKEYIRKNNGITCKCGVCETYFEDYATLQRHMTSLHSIRYLRRCKECDKLFIHALGFTPYETNTCKGCSGLAQEAVAYFYSIRVVDVKYNHYCGICHIKATSQKMILEHLWMHANSLPYVCEICDRGFIEYARSFKDHIKTHFVSYTPASDLGEQGG